jgi:hypothetical protein
MRSPLRPGQLAIRRMQQAAFFVACVLSVWVYNRWDGTVNSE